MNLRIRFVKRIDIVNSILDRINEGEKLTEELRELLKEMGK